MTEMHERVIDYRKYSEDREEAYNIMFKHFLELEEELNEIDRTKHYTFEILKDPKITEWLVIMWITTPDKVEA